MEARITDFITEIRNSFDKSVAVYTQGSCYRFYKILKHVFPDAEPYYDMDHVITKIGDKFYDINGEYKDCKRYLPLSEYPNALKECENWIFREKNN